LIPVALTVTAAIRFSSADSIGVPVFESGNLMYLPEMDADFNIISFLDFENDDKYELTHDIPPSYHNQLFRVGDPAPIIFWFKQAPYIVEGDAEKSRLEQIFGLDARTHPVLRDLGEMLDDARTGKIKAQQEEWFAQEIEASYNDVFLEPPSRTRYWISRYRAALENARKLTQPPHPIDVRLRRASSEWLEKFATKAELPMVASILGEAAQGIYSIRQITEIMLAYISHRITAGGSAEIARLANDDTIRSLFPHGMYDFYLFEGWPHVSFEYNKPDYLGLMKERLIQGRERGSWKTAHLLSLLLFGDKEAPREVDELALHYIRDVIKEYNAALQVAEYDYRQTKRPYDGPELVELAKVIVSRFEQAKDLSCVMHGEDRVRGMIQSGRFGIDEEDAERHRRYLAG
jgi:hypothetical protein